MLVITPACIVCGQRSNLYVEPKRYKRWQQGEFIQLAFPDMSADDRELLVSGTHPKCWVSIFGEED